MMQQGKAVQVGHHQLLLFWDVGAKGGKARHCRLTITIYLKAGYWVRGVADLAAKAQSSADHVEVGPGPQLGGFTPPPHLSSCRHKQPQPLVGLLTAESALHVTACCMSLK